MARKGINDKEKLEKLKRLHEELEVSITAQIAMLESQKRILECGFFTKKKLEKAEEIKNTLCELLKKIHLASFSEEGVIVSEYDIITEYTTALWNEFVLIRKDIIPDITICKCRIFVDWLLDMWLY